MSLLNFALENSTAILVVCVLAVFFYIKVKKKQSYWKEQGVPYAEPPFFFGSVTILFRSKSIAELVQDTYNKFSKERYVGVYQFLQPTLMLRDPNLIKIVTVKEFDHFLNHRRVADVDTDPLWSRNLFASRDQKWRDLRSTLSPSYTASKMKIMFGLIDECAQQFVEYFKKEQSDVVELEMKDTMTRYTNDVIATAAFGLKCDSLRNKTNDFYVMGKEMSNFNGLRLLRLFAYAISPTVPRLLKIRIIPESIANYFGKIIEDTVKVRQEKGIVRPDLIHLLMEAQKGNHHDEELSVNEGFSTVSEFNIHKPRHKEDLTLQDIISQAFIFFVAGFDTVSTLLTFVFYELAVNPDIQERLRKEVQTVTEKISYETLLHLKYLDMVISETLRKWPPAILTDRQVSKPFTIAPERPDEKPVHLPEGMICTVPIFAIHRDPQWYPNPEKFDPERFNDDNKHNINPCTYLPFGAGPRNCIGSRFALLEVKLIVYRVLKHFEIVPIGKTPVPMVLDSYQINPAAKGGMWLGLKRLN